MAAGRGPALAALRHTAPEFVGALRLDEVGAAAGVVHSWLSRVLPGDVRYTGCVHEQPEPARPVRRLPLVVGHDGYGAERLAAKRGRNHALLQAAVETAPALRPPCDAGDGADNRLPLRLHRHPGAFRAGACHPVWPPALEPSPPGPVGRSLRRAGQHQAACPFRASRRRLLQAAPP